MSIPLTNRLEQDNVAFDIHSLDESAGVDMDDVLDQLGEVRVFLILFYLYITCTFRGKRVGARQNGLDEVLFCYVLY